MRPTLVVTDFAGTAMREEGAVLVAYRRALTAFAIPFTEEDLAARRGASKRAVFRELAARAHAPAAVPNVADRALQTFEATLHDEYTTGPVVEVPGAAAAMRCLKEAGVKVALTSGFDRSLVNLLIARLGWEELFDLTVASSDVSQGRPAPFLIYRAMMDLGVVDVGRVAVIGDTPLDLAAGMNARAHWVIGVLSGAHGLETLGATPHTHLLTSIASLPALFDLRDPRADMPGMRSA
jgi:phosphonatase-like hydrolase